jgi:hypothetical protein
VNNPLTKLTPGKSLQTVFPFSSATDFERPLRLEHTKDQTPTERSRSLVHTSRDILSFPSHCRFIIPFPSFLAAVPPDAQTGHNHITLSFTTLEMDHFFRSGQQPIVKLTQPASPVELIAPTNPCFPKFVDYFKAGLQQSVHWLTKVLDDELTGFCFLAHAKNCPIQERCQ